MQKSQNPVVKVRLDPQALRILRERVPPRERGRSGGVGRYIQELVYEHLGLPIPELYAGTASPRRSRQIVLEGKPMVTQAHEMRVAETAAADGRQVEFSYPDRGFRHVFKVSRARLTMEGVGLDDAVGFERLCERWAADLAPMSGQYPFDAVFWVTSDTKTLSALVPVTMRPVVMLSVDHSFDREEWERVIVRFFDGIDRFGYGLRIPREVLEHELDEADPPDRTLLELVQNTFLLDLVSLIEEWGRTSWGFLVQRQGDDYWLTQVESGMTPAWTPGTEPAVITSTPWPDEYQVVYRDDEPA